MTTRRNFINGEWVGSDATFRNINPSDITDVVGEYALGDASHVDAAVEAAKKALPAWTNPQQRSDALDAVGSEILARKEELGRLLSREEGKTLREGIGEVHRAAQIFKYFAGEAIRFGGESIDSVRPGVEVDVRREPVGVVGLITPWNFPIAIPAWKIAPALAYGNTVVLKPSSTAPGSAWALAELLSSRVPHGVFNLTLGSADSVGVALADHPHVAAVSFTGSCAVGKDLAARCAARLVRVQVEMGGKNPLVVLDDADLPTAVETAVNGAYFSAGERCTASSRIIATEGIHDRFEEALTKRVRELRVGHALEPETEIGPVVDENQMNKVLGWIERGEGKLATGGKRLRLKHDGFYIRPALFTGTENDMAINREEVFGPVATLQRVKDYDEALAVANDTEFGLSAGICTTSLDRAHHFRANAQAGLVMVNLPTAGVDYHVPFGGTKGSSYGPREQGRHAVEFYTTVKTCYTAPYAQAR